MIVREGARELEEGAEKGMEGVIPFTRDDLKKLMGAYCEEEIDVTGFSYETETWEHYKHYCQQFTKTYNMWRFEAKLVRANVDNAVRTFSQGLRRVAGVLLLILVSMSASGQKPSERTSAYLSADVYRTEKVSGKVVFMFKIPLIREGGNRTWEQVLTDGRSFEDVDNLGDLTGIFVTKPDGTIVRYPSKAPTRRPQPVEASVGNTEVDPGPSLQERMATAWWLDSAKTAAHIALLDADRDNLSKLIWGRTIQWWDFAMRSCNVGFYLWICVLGIVRLCNQAAVNENRITAYGRNIYGGWAAKFGARSAIATLIVGISGLIIVLIDVMIHWIAGQPWRIFDLILSWGFLSALVFFTMCHYANRLLDWLVVSPKVQGEKDSGWNGDSSAAPITYRKRP